MIFARRMKLLGSLSKFLFVAWVAIVAVSLSVPAYAQDQQPKKTKKAPKKSKSVRTTTTRQAAKEAAEEKRPS